jgi:hypothetical protein
VTRDQQIRKALELLAPPPRDRAECQHDISLALDRVENGAAAARAFRVAGSKKGKAGPSVASGSHWTGSREMGKVIKVAEIDASR